MKSQQTIQVAVKGLQVGLTRFNLDLQEAVWLESEIEDLKTFYSGQNEAWVFCVIQFDLTQFDLLFWATICRYKETFPASVYQGCP